jgi:hypothetical protein
LAERSLRTLLGGGAFFESPRWRDGRWWWVSDFYRHLVLTVDPGDSASPARWWRAAGPAGGAAVAGESRHAVVTSRRLKTRPATAAASAR